MRFRKKPVEVDAVQFTGKHPWPEGVHASTNPRERGEPVCWTLEGPLRVSVGDWIIRGVKGEFYPCKPDVFALTYEEVKSDPVCECGHDRDAHTAFPRPFTDCGAKGCRCQKWNPAPAIPTLADRLKSPTLRAEIAKARARLDAEEDNCHPMPSAPTNKENTK